MDYQSPSNLVLYVAIIGGIPLLYLVGILSFGGLCGVSGFATTENGYKDIKCSCVGVKKVEELESIGFGEKTYCTGLNFSNNDLNNVVRVSNRSNEELKRLGI